MTVARKSPPIAKTSIGSPHPFRVWMYNPTYLEDPRPWKCLAQFYFLTCCLDYIAGCQDANCDVVFQSPADVRTILHTDTRVVFQGNTLPPQRTEHAIYSA